MGKNIRSKEENKLSNKRPRYGVKLSEETKIAMKHSKKVVLSFFRLYSLQNELIGEYNSAVKLGVKDR